MMILFVLMFQLVAEGSAAVAAGMANRAVPIETTSSINVAWLQNKTATAHQQIDMSQLTTLDIDPALKQFIGALVVGFQTQLHDVKNENVALQSRIHVELEQVKNDKEALENKTQVIETALRQENRLQAGQIVALQTALHNILNKTTSDMVLPKGDVRNITVRLDQCEAETTPFIQSMERRRTQDEETLCRGSGLTAMFGSCCPNQGSSGNGHRRFLQGQGCDLPATCSAACASLFIEHFDGCQDVISALALGVQQAFAGLYAVCNEVEQQTAMSKETSDTNGRDTASIQ